MKKLAGTVPRLRVLKDKPTCPDCLPSLAQLLEEQDEPMNSRFLSYLEALGWTSNGKKRLHLKLPDHY